MNSCGALGGEALVERDHDELLDAERGDQLGLGLEAGQQLGRRLGPDHAQRVGLEGQHRVVAGDHLAVAEVDAVELAHRDPPGPRLHIGEHRHLHRRGSLEKVGRDAHAQRNTTIGFRVPGLGPGSARAISPSASVSRTSLRGPSPGALDRTPCAARRASSGSSALGQEVQRRRQRPTGRSGSASPTSKAPIRVRRSCLAVGVAEIGDQAAHIGPRGALDHEAAALALRQAPRSGGPRPRARPARPRPRRGPARRRAGRRP